MRPTTTTMTKSHHTVAPSDMMCWVPPTVSSIAIEHPCPTICGASGNIGTISAKCTRALLAFEPMLWHITLIYVRRRLHNTPNQRDHCYCGTFHRRTPPRSRCEHTVGHRLQQLHDTCLVMTSCATVDTHTYTHAKLVRADVVTLVVAANHGANTANDQLRRATLEFATAMANIGPDTPHPNTLTSHNTPKRTPSRRWRAGFRASQSSESPAPAHTHATRDWSLRRGHVPAPASPGRLPATRGCRVQGGG